jgi:hypothetical protein
MLNIPEYLLTHNNINDVKQLVETYQKEMMKSNIEAIGIKNSTRFFRLFAKKKT